MGNSESAVPAAVLPTDHGKEGETAGDVHSVAAGDGSSGSGAFPNGMPYEERQYEAHGGDAKLVDLQSRFDELTLALAEARREVKDTQAEAERERRRSSMFEDNLRRLRVEMKHQGDELRSARAASEQLAEELQSARASGSRKSSMSSRIDELNEMTAARDQAVLECKRLSNQTEVETDRVYAGVKKLRQMYHPDSARSGPALRWRNTHPATKDGLAREVNLFLGKIDFLSRMRVLVLNVVSQDLQGNFEHMDEVAKDRWLGILIKRLDDFRKNVD